MLRSHRSPLVVCIALLTLTPIAAAQNPGSKFAAVSAHTDGDLQVVWADTKQAADDLALKACQRKSSTCARPASTDVLDDVFALMCCTSPQLSCASPSHESKEKAEAVALKLLSDLGYSRCSVRAYYSARTGSRVR